MLERAKCFLLRPKTFLITFKQEINIFFFFQSIYKKSSNFFLCVHSIEYFIHYHPTIPQIKGKLFFFSFIKGKKKEIDVTLYSLTKTNKFHTLQPLALYTMMSKRVILPLLVLFIHTHSDNRLIRLIVLIYMYIYIRDNQMRKVFVFYQLARNRAKTISVIISFSVVT